MTYIIILIIIALIAYFGKYKVSGIEKIQIEMIPASQHYKNVRAVLTNEEWTRIAKLHSQEAKNQCEICKRNTNLECHEIWSFNESSKVQKLMGMNLRIEQGQK